MLSDAKRQVVDILNYEVFFQIKHGSFLLSNNMMRQ